MENESTERETGYFRFVWLLLSPGKLGSEILEICYRIKTNWVPSLWFAFLLRKDFIIPPKGSLGAGYIGVTQWSVSQSVSPAVCCIFLVRSITWRLMVRIQYNFIQWSSTLRGSEVHKNNNTILTNYRVIPLWYFSLSAA
jgi:hypothetical protein